MTMSKSVKTQTNKLLPNGCYISVDDTDTGGVGVVGKPIRVVERGQSMYYTVEEAQRLYDALEVALSEVDDDE